MRTHWDQRRHLHLILAQTMQKALITIGIVIVVAGLLWPWLGKLPLGRLPGDIIVNRPNLKIYIPITSMVVISIALSLVIWLLRIFRK